MCVALRKQEVLETWLDACAVDEIAPASGVCALVGARQIAVVRAGDAIYAIDNFDPFAKAYMLSRGPVGQRGGVPTIASPVYQQQRFDLRSGQCLDDPSLCLRVWQVRVRDRRVQILDE